MGISDSVQFLFALPRPSASPPSAAREQKNFNDDEERNSLFFELGYLTRLGQQEGVNHDHRVHQSLNQHEFAFSFDLNFGLFWSKSSLG